MKAEQENELKEELEKRRLDACLPYDMSLHENLEISCGAITYNVTRVPGGWIYNHVRLDRGVMSSVFVPYDFEFKENNPKY